MVVGKYWKSLFSIIKLWCFFKSRKPYVHSKMSYALIHSIQYSQIQTKTFQTVRWWFVSWQQLQSKLHGSYVQNLGCNEITRCEVLPGWVRPKPSWIHCLILNKIFSHCILETFYLWQFSFATPPSRCVTPYGSQLTGQEAVLYSNSK